MFLSHTPFLHSHPSFCFSPLFICLFPLSCFPYFVFSCLLSNLHHPEFFICTSSSLPLLSSHLPTSYILLQSFRTSFVLFTSTSLLAYTLLSSVSPFLCHPSLRFSPLSSHLHSAPPQRAPGASPSAHNISSAAVSDRPNFSRGVGIRSTFHAGQQRGARDQQGSAYPGGPASPSLSHGNSQARRTHGATGIFSKFTSKFVRR